MAGHGGGAPPSACKRNSSTVGVSEEESVHPKGTYESVWPGRRQGMSHEELLRGREFME